MLKDNICMSGLYRHEPSSLLSRHDDLFWCQNWTFRPYECKDGTIMMKDTYWSGSGGLHIKLTEKNISEFTLIFDYKQVEKENYPEFYNEEDLFRNIPVDSGGIQFPKTFRKKSAKRSKSKMIEYKQQEIQSLKRKIEFLESEIKALETR